MQTGILEKITKADSVSELIVDLVDVLIILAVPIIVLFIMYAGFLFITAQGNETKISKAKRTLLWTVAGGVITLGAKLIIQVIQNTTAGLIF